MLYCHFYRFGKESTIRSDSHTDTLVAGCCSCSCCCSLQKDERVHRQLQSQGLQLNIQQWKSVRARPVASKVNIDDVVLIPPCEQDDQCLVDWFEIEDCEGFKEILPVSAESTDLVLQSAPIPANRPAISPTLEKSHDNEEEETIEDESSLRHVPIQQANKEIKTRDWPLFVNTKDKVPQFQQKKNGMSRMRAKKSVEENLQPSWNSGRHSEASGAENPTCQQSHVAKHFVNRVNQVWQLDRSCFVCVTIASSLLHSKYNVHLLISELL